MFTVCPEAIVSVFLCDVMADNEAILLVGVEQFCDFTGYGCSFEYSGPHEEMREKMKWKIPQSICENWFHGDDAGIFEDDLESILQLDSWIIAMDAVPFRKNLSLEFSVAGLSRELAKAVISFSNTIDASDFTSRDSEEKGNEEINLEQDPRPVITGNWGCGVFGGNPQLKSMIQWIAVSLVNRPSIEYYAFGEKRIVELEYLVSEIKNAGWTVGDLLLRIEEYSHEIQQNENYGLTLFEHLSAALTPKIQKERSCNDLFDCLIL